MASRWHSIGAEAHRALTTSAAYDGPRVIITDELEPPVWQQVKTVLETLGAVYVVGASAFEFEPDQDAHAVVSGALTAGRVMSAAGTDGFVSTPPELAAELVDMYGQLHPPRGRQLRVLEPSAGVGRFVAAITRDLSPEWMRVVAVEPDPRRARQIPANRSVSVVVDTFEAYARRARRAGERFDVVVMNPPFAVPRRGSLWAEHLLTAWELLAPGGRLVAVAPASVLEPHHRSRAARQAAALVYEHGAGRRLDADAFAESSITYATAVVRLDRPLRDQPVSSPTPSPRWRFRTYTGEEKPVPVTRPYLTRGAARSMPVQVWPDPWRGEQRVLRYHADCLTCTRPVWGFDDRENDPRGVLGAASAAWSLDPREHDQPAGEPVALCAECGGDGTTHQRALFFASRVWEDAAASAEQVPPRPHPGIAPDVAAPSPAQSEAPARTATSPKPRPPAAPASHPPAGRAHGRAPASGAGGVPGRPPTSPPAGPPRRPAR